MEKISVYLTVALMVISAIVGVGIGYMLTPQYTLSMYDKNVMDLGRPDKWLDLRYVDSMISHHRGAILLAEQAELSERTEVRELAKEIQKGEPVLIAELYAWKKEWYGDTRTVTDPVVAKLGSYDATFDLRFLNALIAHHESGVRMTKEVRLKSSRGAILDNANAVEAFLTGSEEMLKGWRSAWYSI
jgi:uncharacterized protein (DUF305 family)